MYLVQMFFSDHEAEFVCRTLRSAVRQVNLYRRVARFYSANIIAPDGSLARHIRSAYAS